MSRGEKGTTPFQPRFPGKGTGGDFMNASMVFGEGESNKLAGVERG